MAKAVNINTIIAANEIRDLSVIHSRREIYRENLRGLRKVDLRKTHVLIGDRTGNTPSLRKHARQSMRFDKELSTIAYLVQPGGKYWHESVPMTLAIITKARMIMASNKNIKHEGEDRRFLIT
jgi:hypothetical protein